MLGNSLSDVPPSVATPLVPQFSGLSRKQAEACHFAMRGLPAKVIAARMGVSPGTVKGHLHKAYERLEVSSRREMVQKLGAAVKPDGAPARLPEKLLPVAEAIARNLSDAQISAALQITLPQVKYAVRRVRAALGGVTREEVIAWYLSQHPPAR